MHREQILDTWLSETLSTQNFKRLPLAGDASFRRYYRIYLEDSQYVVMDAPPPEVPQLFVTIAKLLATRGLQVPTILAANIEQGFLLLTDLGDRLYLSELNEDTANILYQDAFNALLKLQDCVAEVPKFNQIFLQNQLGIFEEWYLQKHLRLRVTEQMQAILTAVYQYLFQVIQQQPQVFVHRDYHSRNLMITANNNPGILDFQDAMVGPITYDLVSLLQDCYIAWPRERIVDWVFAFYLQVKKKGLLNAEIDRLEFLRWFDLTGLQRHLKNLGIFARLHHRDKKSGYLKDIPQVLKYIRETSQRYQELHTLFQFFVTLPDTVETKCEP